MIKKIFLVVLLFSGACAFSKPTVKPLFWKIQKAEHVGYVLGTFHLGVALNDFPEVILDYLNESDFLYTEANMATVDQNKILARATFQNGQALDQFLPKASWDKLVSQLENVMPAENLRQFKPWYISLILSTLAVEQLGNSGRLDFELHEYAKNRSVDLSYLETADLQFSVLEGISSPYVLDRTIKSSDNIIDGMAKHFGALKQCYVDGDILCLEDQLFAKSEVSELTDWQYDLLFVLRNKTWVPVIENALSKGQAFFAVGAGHLIGRENVLDLLRAQGYHVEQIKF